MPIALAENPQPQETVNPLYTQLSAIVTKPENASYILSQQLENKDVVVTTPDGSKIEYQYKNIYISPTHSLNLISLSRLSQADTSVQRTFECILIDRELNVDNPSQLLKYSRTQFDDIENHDNSTNTRFGLNDEVEDGVTVKDRYDAIIAEFDMGLTELVASQPPLSSEALVDSRCA